MVRRLGSRWNVLLVAAFAIALCCIVVKIDAFLVGRDVSNVGLRRGRRVQRGRPLLHAQAEVEVLPGHGVHLDFEMSRADTRQPVHFADVSPPLRFVCGDGQVSPILDEAARQMFAGDRKLLCMFAALSESDATEVLSLSFEKAEPHTVPVSLTLTVLDVDQVPDESGVLVQTVIRGDGKNFPQPGDKVTVHYTGILAANRRKFDSSLDRGKPFGFTVGAGEVIRGLDIGILKMSLGEKARITIPSALGYGSFGSGKLIPPDADLKFQVNLLSINGKETGAWRPLPKRPRPGPIPLRGVPPES